MKASLITDEFNGRTGAYRVPRHPAPMDLRLDGNEGQVVCQNLLDSVSKWEIDDIRQYPSTARLEAEIAGHFNVTPEQVLVTAGADDGLLRMCRAFLSPHRDLVLPVPTFEMIERFAEWCFACVKTVPWEGGPYPTDDVLSMVDQRTGLIAVVSPNNPTGGIIGADALRRLSSEAQNSMLMVDGAYAEFADEDLTDTVLSLPNAVIFRTMSKALGLAGLRVGFALGPVKTIERLRGMGMPYPVSSPSLQLARVGLDRRFQSQPYIDAVKRERESLLNLLTEVGMRACPSQGNFVFARTDDSQWWRDGLAGLGIGVRIWPDKPDLANAMRVTCPGDADEFNRLVHSLKTIAKPEAILFDIDGVLVDVKASYRAAIIETARTFEVSVTPEDIDICKRAGNANNDWLVTQQLLFQNGVELDLDTVKSTFEALYWGTAQTSGLHVKERFIGDRDTLVALSQRLPLAAVTGRPRRDALHVLERFGILECFSSIVTMDDAPAKPDPSPVSRALAALNVRRAWMLGDTRDDVIAARGAGVLPIGVLAPGTTDPTLDEDTLLRHGAARVFDTWTELEAYLP